MAYNEARIAQSMQSSAEAIRDKYHSGMLSGVQMEAAEELHKRGKIDLTPRHALQGATLGYQEPAKPGSNLRSPIPTTGISYGDPFYTEEELSQLRQQQQKEQEWEQQYGASIRGLEQPWIDPVEALAGGLASIPRGLAVAGAEMAIDPLVGFGLERALEGNDALTAMAGGRRGLSKVVRTPGTLIVQHNLSQQNLAHAEKMGGLPVPSLAVTKADDPMTNFGDISLIGSKELIDPTGGTGAKVFGADVYSPRYPTVNYSVDPKEYTALRNRLKSSETELGGHGMPTDLEGKGIQDIMESTVAQFEYLKSVGKAPKVAKRKYRVPSSIRKLGAGRKTSFAIQDDPRFNKIITDKYKERAEATANKLAPDKSDPQHKIVLEDMIDTYFDADGEVRRRFKDEFSREIELDNRSESLIDFYSTRDAIDRKMRSPQTKADYENWVHNEFNPVFSGEKLLQGFTHGGTRKYKPHTMENVVKEMKKDIRGGENFNYGPGSLRAMFTTEFKSLKQIKGAEGRLVSGSEFEGMKDDLSNQLSSLYEEMEPFMKFKSDNQFTNYDTFVEQLGDIKGLGIRGMLEEYFPGAPTKGVKDLITTMGDFPTEYFEANILRAVGIDEFSAAVVPTGTPQRVIDRLKRKGLKVTKYKKGDQSARKAAIGKLKDLRFSVLPASMLAAASGTEKQNQ